MPPILTNRLFNVTHWPCYTSDLITLKLNPYSVINIFKVMITASNADFILSSFVTACFVAMVSVY